MTDYVNETDICDECDGEGALEVDHWGAFIVITCPECLGTGVKIALIDHHHELPQNSI